MPPWRNPSLITAIAASFIMHFVILYFKITNVSIIKQPFAMEFVIFKLKACSNSVVRLLYMGLLGA